MPLWTIYHPPTAFTSPDTKAALANAITKIYTNGLPAFYVVVLFQVIEPSSFFVGGVPRPSPHVEANQPGPDSSRPFIRVVIQHIARKISEDDAVRDRFLNRVDAVLKPFIADKGYDWEHNVVETARDLWKVQGMVPPMPNTEAEKEWVRLNNAVEFEREKGGLEKL